jgi:hypothetical protein
VIARIDFTSLAADLERIANRIETDVTKKALYRVSDLAKQHIWQTVAFKNHTYNLLNSVKITKETSNTVRLEATAHYAQWVEFGRGWVYPVRAKALRFVIDGNVIFAKKSKPVRPRFFMKSAAHFSRNTYDRIVQPLLNEVI